MNLKKKRIPCIEGFFRNIFPTKFADTCIIEFVEFIIFNMAADIEPIFGVYLYIDKLKDEMQMDALKQSYVPWTFLNIF